MEWKGIVLQIFERNAIKIKKLIKLAKSKNIKKLRRTNREIYVRVLRGFAGLRNSKTLSEDFLFISRVCWEIKYYWNHHFLSKKKGGKIMLMLKPQRFLLSHVNRDSSHKRKKESWNDSDLFYDLKWLMFVFA